MATLRFTLLGCGASPGVPRADGDWGACDPAEPRNRRTRAAAMFELFGDEGPRPTRVLIDTGPDLRQQMLASGIRHLDAVVYTHAHADHVHGIDDLRAFWIGSGKMVDIYSDDATQERLNEGFGYCFTGTRRGSYPPILKRHRIHPGRPIEVVGDGGVLTLMPFEQQHGDIHSLGLRAGGIAYCCDVSAFPPTAIPYLENLDLLVVDALRLRPHPSHFTIDEALKQIAAIDPRRAVLTHMHGDLDYRAAAARCPRNVEPGYDRYAFEMPVTDNA